MARIQADSIITKDLRTRLHMALGMLIGADSQPLPAAIEDVQNAENILIRLAGYPPCDGEHAYNLLKAGRKTLAIDEIRRLLGTLKGIKS